MHEIMGIQQAKAKVTSPPPSKGFNADTKTKQAEGSLKHGRSRSADIIEDYKEINLSVI